MFTVNIIYFLRGLKFFEANSARMFQGTEKFRPQNQLKSRLYDEGYYDAWYADSNKMSIINKFLKNILGAVDIWKLPIEM